MPLRLDGARPSRLGASALRGGFVAAGFLAIAVFGVALVRQDNDSELRRSLERQAVLSRVLSDLQDAESTQRGFLLTGSPRYTQLYDQAVGRVGSDVASLEAALSSEPGQMTWVARLKSLADVRLGELGAALLAAKGGQHAAAVAASQPREDGTRMVETARSYIAQINAMEAKATDERRSRSRTAGIATGLAAAGLITLMTALALAAIREAQRRERLTRYLPSEIAAQLADGAASLHDGEHRQAAVVFVDIRGSTALAERLSSNAFRAILTTFRRQVSEAARQSSGVVDKFIGDGALVIFGLAGPVEHACREAIEFAERLAGAVASDPAGLTGTGPIRIGFGIHFGSLFCGVVGDAERQEFTVLGDTVNVAARLQEQTKTHDVALLVSAAVVGAVGQYSDGRWRRIGSLSLPGRSEAIETFTTGLGQVNRPAASRL